MIVHGSFKIMSNMEYILKYLENTFPAVKQYLFDHIKGDNLNRLIKWHQVNLRPRSEKLTQLQLAEKVTNDEK